ncbi:MAG TPA: tetratricopeptide repeat protein [Terracidiphilus sp.]|nr:tetratricopeptide repeat protein [Terracidiphilus sp.]
MPAKSIVSALFILIAISTTSAGQATPDDKEQIAQHENLAQQYLREQRPDLAIPELKKIVSLDPNNLEARANLGVLLFFRGDYADAVPQLQTAIHIQPDLWKVRSLLGLAEEHTGDPVDARKDLEASFPMIEERKLKIDVGLDLVGLYTASGELDKAAGLVSQLKTAYPESPEVLYAAYRTYADLSGESMLSLSLVAPDSAQMHQLLAHEETREGNTNGAIAQYRKAIAINPHLPGAHFELAELLNTSQNPAIKKQAEQEYRAALADNPLDVKTECDLAEIALTKGDVNSADHLYSNAIELHPNDASAKLGLAKVMLEMDKPDKALPLLEASVQLEPTNATAHYRLAMLYKKTGRTEDAKRELLLYQKYKEMKDKLRGVYKELQIQPDEIKSDEDADK